MVLRLAGVAVPVLLVALLLGAAAQHPQPVTPEAAARAPGQIVVRVRTPSGAPPLAQAWVKLYSNVGSLQLFAPTQENAEAVFRRIPAGEYRVEVTAPGYEIANEEAALWMPGGTAYVFVYLRPESVVKSTLSPPGPPVLAPKARKETQKGLEALRASDLKEAQTRLERAAKLAPGHPEVNYLLGMLYLRLKDLDQAKTRLEKAASLDPNHTGALTTIGWIRCQQGDYPGAIRALESALRLDLGSWEAHWIIASAYYHERQFENARTHAERALETGKTKAPQIQLLLAQALAALGQREKAAQELASFLNRHPEHPGAVQARRLLEQMHADSAKAATPSHSTDGATSASPPAAPSEPLMPVRRWAPPGVDEAVPPVASDVTCSLPQALTGAAQRAVALADNLERVTATERIEHTELDKEGNSRHPEARTFDYLVSIRKIGPQMLSVEETRNGQASLDSFPTRMATTGLAALALIFHPLYVDDFALRCEGLGQWHGQPAWQLYFRQRQDRPSRVRAYNTKSGLYPVKLKGRAWIAANSYHVLRLETDLVEPIKEIILEQEHLIVEYTPVQFVQRNLQLWLPANADLYMHFRGHRHHHRHSFSNFLLFSVDVQQQIHDPKQP